MSATFVPNKFSREINLKAYSAENPASALNDSSDYVNTIIIHNQGLFD
jgi:hypothetical protein